MASKPNALFLTEGVANSERSTFEYNAVTRQFVDAVDAVNMGSSAHSLVLSRDNVYLAVLASSWYLFKFEDGVPTQVNGLVGNAAIIGSAVDVSFTADSSKVAVFHNDGVEVYDLTTNTMIYDLDIYDLDIASAASNSLGISGLLRGGTISDDGLTLAIYTSTSPYLYHIRLSAGSVAPDVLLPAVSGFANVSPARIYITPDGVYSYCNYDLANGFKVTEISNGVDTGVNIVVPADNTMALPVASPNNQLVVMPRGHFVVLVDIATNTPSVIEDVSSTSDINGIAWLDDDTLVVGRASWPAITTYKISTGEWSVLFNKRACHGLAAARKGVEYEITGTIAETLTQVDWRCSAYSTETAELVGTVITSGTTFAIPVPDNTPCLVVVSQPNVLRWQADTHYSVGDEVHPTDANALPYYYTCIGTGNTGSTEPSWGTAVASQTQDGTVTWELTETMPTPIARQPLTPTPV